MARPRKPTVLHLLQGSEQNHPERMKARSNEPRPTEEIGPWVDHTGKTEAQAWDLLVSNCAPGVLTCMDRATLELAAWLLYRFWNHRAEFDNASLKALQSLLSSFGMNPSDRSKIVVPKDRKPDSPFAKFRTG